jgi:two-component system sensor histidine kinase/response regulator
LRQSDSWPKGFEDGPQEIDRRPGGPALSASASTDAQESILDRTELLERMGGDREILAEIVGLFLRHCPKQLAELSEAVARGDALRIERAAHALKGEVSNLASAPATAAALRLELMGRDGNLAGAREGFADLERAVEQLKVALTAIGAEVG